jgi:DNA-binding beta-propeller fold protein YncE
VYERNGKWLQDIGGHGTEPGQFKYPYDVAFGPKGDLYVMERGNSRVQKLTAAGKPMSMWGTPGRQPGQLHEPWALAVDSQDRVHVIDSENHRVQRIRL